MDTTMRSFAVLRRLLFATLVLAALPGFAVGRGEAKQERGAPAAELYVADGSFSGSLLPLDAGSLGEMPDRPEVPVGTTNGWAPVLSADGSTLAVAAGIGTAIVRDGLFGPERLRIAAEGEIGQIVLSRDGRRLVILTIGDSSGTGPQPPIWKVFGADDGGLLTTIESDAPEQWQVSAVDSDAERLYVLTLAEGASPETGPHPTRLIAYDLTSGKELGRMALPEVQAGFWMSDEVVEFEGGGQERLSQARVPGFALSPDGRCLAIAHADDEGLTLIDTATLTIERTVAISRKQGLLGQLAGLVPLLPQGASAKAMEGTMLQAVFGPDGKRLYLFGAEASVEDGVPSYHGIGLRSVDVENGDVAAEASGPMQIELLVPSPDGGSLFLAGWADEATNANPHPPFLIRRVDAESLEVLAEREFNDWRPFLLRSALAEPDLPLAVELVEMAIVPGMVTVPAGTEVRLTVANHGTVAHSFRADDGDTGDWEVRVDLAPGETKTVAIEAPAGEYKMICDVAGHAEAGMGGILFAR